MLKLFVPSKAPSHRQQKVAEEVRYILSNTIQTEELPVTTNDDNIYVKPNAPITITYVSMSPDLKHAQVGIMPLGGVDQEKVEEYMRLNGWFLRKHLAKQLRTRSAPNLIFRLDLQFDAAAKIDSLIDKIHSH
jgi:ribosome-binding factor A